MITNDQPTPRSTKPLSMLVKRHIPHGTDDILTNWTAVTMSSEDELMRMVFEVLFDNYNYLLDRSSSISLYSVVEKALSQSLLQFSDNELNEQVHSLILDIQRLAAMQYGHYVYAIDMIRNRYKETLVDGVYTVSPDTWEIAMRVEA